MILHGLMFETQAGSTGSSPVEGAILSDRPKFNHKT